MDAALADPRLAGAKDLCVSNAAPLAYVAASLADSIAIVRLSAAGLPLGVEAAAAKDGADLANFSRPNCLALSPDGTLLAAGTAGDDAVYFFDTNPATGSLSLCQRIDKSAFPAATPLSDPDSLAFSPDGLSLYVLSYYGKSLVRLDRPSLGAAFGVGPGVKSGTAGVVGFATPSRLALSPDGRMLAVSGSGSEDGLSLFDTSAPAGLSYLGSILPGTDGAVPAKPTSVAFSPDGKQLAVCADGHPSFFSVLP